MENIDKIIIGVTLFTITSILAYLFKMRQLYVVAPRLYKHATVSSAGSLCELIVLNKGNQVEEEIRVELDSELKYELLASNSSNVSLENASLKISRLHKGCDESAILLVENGQFDHSKIKSLSSKGTKGSVHKKIESIPPNYAKIFLLYVGLFLIFPSMYYGQKTYSELRSDYVQYILDSAKIEGWRSLEKYFSSDLRQSYSNNEFPIKFISKSKTKNGYLLNYEIYNKTATVLDVSASHPRNEKTKPIDLNYFSSTKIPPMSKGQIAVHQPPSSDGTDKISVEFSIKMGNEFIYDIFHDVKAN